MKMIKLRETAYLNLMIILAPMINFISGISVDLYAPSMPAIAVEFHTTVMTVQNTITLSIVGWAIGCLFWGILYDVLGRKKIILSVLIVFVISSLAATHCHNISQLMAIRFIQGVATAAMSVGSRSLVADHFAGHRFTVAIIYTSFAYGFGPVVAPFIGGYLQYHFGWQANFYAFAIFGSVMFLAISLFVQERFEQHISYTVSKVIECYKSVVTHKIFLFGCLIVGISQIEMMIYPAAGSFIVEKQLHYSSIVYGNSAVIAGIGYLSGAITNRILLKSFSQNGLITAGYTIMGIALIIQALFAMFGTIGLWTLVPPIALICFANGFIVGNVISNCLKLFPNNIGIATATQICALMLIGGFGIFTVSALNVSSLPEILYIFATIIVIQFLSYKCYFSKVFN
jgi:MFS family permease